MYTTLCILNLVMLALVIAFYIFAALDEEDVAKPLMFAGFALATCQGIFAIVALAVR